MKFTCFALVFLIFLSCNPKKQDNTLGNTNERMQTIQYIDRKSGEIKTENVPGKGYLNWLYSSKSGELALHALIKRKIVSSIAGRFMNSSLSTTRIACFIKKHHIDINEFEITDISQFKTFNDFFCRKIKPDARPVRSGLVSAADGRITVFPEIDQLTSFFIKNTEFTLEKFLQNKSLADKYIDGAMAIIRLAPVDYHRFHFPASGVASESTKINGSYFSVSPLALQKSLRIFCENKREYTTLKSAELGDVLIVEIGATMVGSIFQTYTPGNVKKGQEKGHFAFGGSTVVLLFEKDKISFDSDLLKNTHRGFETLVKMGEQIASQKNNS